MDEEEFLTDLIIMVDDGLLLAQCPNCLLFLSIEELEHLLCSCSDSVLDIENEVIFTNCDELPKA